MHVVECVGRDHSRLVQQRIGIDTIVTFVLRVIVQRDGSLMIRCGDIAHDDAGLPVARDVALDGLSQVVATLLIGFQRQHGSVKISIRQCDAGVKANVRTDVNESHATSKVRAEERDLLRFIDSKPQRTGNDRIVWVDPDERIPDSHVPRQQELDYRICRSPQWWRFQQDRVDQFGYGHCEYHDGSMRIGSARDRYQWRVSSEGTISRRFRRR